MKKTGTSIENAKEFNVKHRKRKALFQNIEVPEDLSPSCG